MDSRLLELNLKTSLSAIASLALPGRCVVCGRRLNLRERDICLECMADLPLTHYGNMLHNPMADRYNTAINEGLEEYEPYQAATALIFYSSFDGYANIPRDLKYYRNTRTGRAFSHMLALSLREGRQFDDIDLVVPVPLHWMRRLKRGYNQAEVIAKEVSCTLGVKMEPHLLRRSRRTSTQTAVGVGAKARNVRGAFTVNSGKARKRNVVHHILLVDDVLTTGATLAECHRALRSFYGSGVRISCATLAMVG